jgi:hypothetical protein
MLETGNTAINWLEKYKNGESISAIIGASATAMELEEKYPEVSPGAVVREGYLG